MSDQPSDDLLRDQRFAAADFAFAIEADLRDNPTIKSLIAGVREDAERAMDELADVAPADVIAISRLLVRVSTLVYIRRTLNRIILRGHAAAASIRAQDEAAEQE